MYGALPVTLQLHVCTCVYITTQHPSPRHDYVAISRQCLERGHSACVMLKVELCGGCEITSLMSIEVGM